MKCYIHEEREATGTCTECGNFICSDCEVTVDGKKVCKKCVEKGLVQKNNKAANSGEKSWVVALLLCIFGGGLGLHRFYAGKIGTGVLMLLTAGGCGIWAIIDLVLICCKKFTDNDGNVIEN